MGQTEQMAGLPEEGVRLTMAFESMLKKIGDGKVKAYLDPVRVVTIGYGTTRWDVPSLSIDTIWTITYAEGVFFDSLRKKYLPVVEKWAQKSPKKLTSQQMGALLSMVYNCGEGIFYDPKTGNLRNIGRALVAGKLDEVPEYMSRWDKAGGKTLAGLVRRRKAEGLLWKGDIAGASRTAETTLEIHPQARSREVPTPNAKDLAVRTTKESGALAAGGGTSGTVAAQSKAPSPAHYSGLEIGLVLGGALVAVVALVLLVRKSNFLKENWA